MTSSNAQRGSGRFALLLALVCTALVSLALAGTARADFGVRAFTGEVANVDNTPATQAGSHPHRATVAIEFNNHVGPTFGFNVPDEDVKTISVDLPPGFSGNPSNVPKCDEDVLQNTLDLACPSITQVGFAKLNIAFGGDYYTKVFNMVPPPGLPAQFAMQVAGVVVHMNARVRSDSDYGLTVDVPDVSQKVGLNSAELTFWGVPADPSNDDERGACISQGGPSGGFCPSDAPRKPFLTNPMHCDGRTLTTTLRTTPWVDSSRLVTASFDHDINDVPMIVEGCERIPFDGSLAVKPVSTAAGVPSGYAFDLTIPQSNNPDGLDTGHLRKVIARLPTGMAVNPSSADGLEGCTDDQFGVKRLGDPACADRTRIGSVVIDTPLLDTPLTGDIILGQPLPGQLLRLFLVARGSGVTVKLPGNVTPDPATGQLTATFDNNPQLPFTNLHLEFKGGPRAPLSNPPVRGTYTTTTELISWTGKSVTSTSSFTIDSGPTSLGFTPGFSAGTSSPAAGASTPFTLSFSRDDDDQLLKDIVVNMRAGITGMLSSPDLCSEGLAAAGACTEASRIGSTATGAGAGTNPFYLPGRVYITGPYKGAPFGLSIVVPAIAGPFNLGTVVVRAAIFVDPRTAALTVASDPLPTILEGIPLQIRDVRVAIDRPGFMINPTNCAPGTVSGEVGSAAGAQAAVSSRFQVTNCRALPYAPKMTLKVGARGFTKRESTTPLVVTLNMTRGQANNKVVQVTLPKALNSRLEVVNRRSACSIEQFRADRCPFSVGTATAVTPLLRDPLRGPAYLVYTPDRRLPDLVVRLRGQVNVDLTGKVTVTRDLKLRTAFDTVPDVPITKFTLRLVSGRYAPIGVVRNLCLAETRRDLKANLAMTAQSGRKDFRDQKISVAGCGRASRGRARAKKK